jgi:hypothetical protein
MMGWKILVPFRTTKFCSPNWNLDKSALFKLKISSSDGSMAQFPILTGEFETSMQNLLFFHNDIVGSTGSILGRGIIFVS